MESYIRFQTQLRCGNTGRPAGVFVAAGRVEDRAGVPEVTRRRLQEQLRWFNQNLTVPAIDDSHWRCLFWFRSGAQVIVRRLWELAHLLEDEGIHIDKLRSHDPGTIVYRDAYQIAAVPPRTRRSSR